MRPHTEEESNAKEMRTRDTKKEREKERWWGEGAVRARRCYLVANSLGKKPDQRAWGPCACTTLTPQSKKFL